MEMEQGGGEIEQGGGEIEQGGGEMEQGEWRWNKVEGDGEGWV